MFIQKRRIEHGVTRVGSLLLMLIFLAVAASLLPTGAYAAVSASVIAGPVNVYATAHLGSPVVAQLASGAAVQVNSYDANWAEILLTGGQSGYVVTSTLNFGAYPPIVVPTTPPTISTTATVVSGPLNVHSASSLSAPVIQQLPTGTRVSVISYSNSWTEILLSSGAVGFVVTSYLSIGSHLPTPTVVPNPTHELVQTAGANATIQTTNHGPLHLRAHPSFDAAILESFANGSRVEVMSKSGLWYYVKAGHSVGYMDVEYVSLDGGVSFDEGDGSGFDAVVNNATDGEILHMRSRPTTDSEIVGEYHNGTYVQVIDMGTEWYHVIVDGKEGFMMAAFVRVTSPSATAEHTVTSKGQEVSLHSQPNASSGAVLTLQDGDIVTVLTPDLEWSEVEYTWDGTTERGYLQNTYLEQNALDIDSFNG